MSSTVANVGHSPCLRICSATTAGSARLSGNRPEPFATSRPLGRVQRPPPRLNGPVTVTAVTAVAEGQHW